MNFLKKLFRRFDKKTQTAFVSDIDKFIQKFDETHPQDSVSQLFEINRQNRVAYLRDYATNAANENKIWEKF